MSAESSPSEGADSIAEPDPWDDDPAHHRVNVVELRRRLGQRIDLTIDIVLARQIVVGSRTLREPVTGNLMVESIERGVSATGTVSFEWEGDCRRCLEVVAGKIEIDIAEIFLIGAPEDADIIDFDGEMIDLLPMVRDAVALSLPLVPLCRDDCAGPDPDRYPTLLADTDGRGNDGDNGEDQLLALDPRWAGLDQLDLRSEPSES
ncbi:MAG: DUF177 domain-containing protein [Actinomycetia bacterium]|nr:DUF177 domain-containing protein [Actinomycetes bacterium]MCP4226066.1 DUF177 domain-containing protein [Actinomycetes bacterium]MCP5031977.1 DUF177 domain-containing protein [Actinomycetes bacterium]